MTIDFAYSAIAMAIVALVTWLTRGMPHLLFGGRKELPATVLYLGAVLPAAIMVILVAYCLRNIDVTSFPFGLAEVFSILLVILAQALRKNALFSILIGTVCYMILIRTVFPA